MAIKDWEKEVSKNRIFFDDKKVNYEHTIDLIKENNIWHVHVHKKDKKSGYEKFKSKLQALKAAREYMRKN